VERDRPAFAGELIETFIALFTSAEILCTLHREHSQFNVLYILRLSRFARVLLRVSRRAAQPAGIPLSETGVDMLSLSLSLSRARALSLFIYIYLSFIRDRAAKSAREEIRIGGYPQSRAISQFVNRLETNQRVPEIVEIAPRSIQVCCPCRTSIRNA